MIKSVMQIAEQIVEVVCSCTNYEHAEMTIAQMVKEHMAKAVEAAYCEGWNEAAPKVPHASRFNLQDDWKNSDAYEAIS